MKRIRCLEGLGYWGEKKPSKSFLKKLSEALTIQIADLIELTDYKKSFVDALEVGFDHLHSRYDITEPSRIRMKIEAKSTSLILSYITVFWKCVDSQLENVINPWSDVSAIDIEFKMVIVRDGIQKLNYLLPELYIPIVRGKECGLPYDYQIKSQSMDGVLRLTCLTDVSEKEVIQIESKLGEFFNEYNSKYENKIHFYSDAKKIKKNQIAIMIDFGNCYTNAIKECVYCFRELLFIKKIVYQ